MQSLQGGRGRTGRAMAGRGFCKYPCKNVQQHPANCTQDLTLTLGRIPKWDWKFSAFTIILYIFSLYFYFLYYFIFISVISLVDVADKTIFRFRIITSFNINLCFTHSVSFCSWISPRFSTIWFWSRIR